jgi:ribosomal subunit interface protein
VDIVVKGRQTEVTERLRQHITEKLAKIEKLDSKIISIDVECSKERNPRLSDQCERIELTMYSRGPVIRAEASAQDWYGALDIAVGRLEARLRKAADRRRVHHGRKVPVSVHTATAALDPDTLRASSSNGSGTDADTGAEPVSVEGDEQALYEMELVGHDFYLFVDAATAQPSVVYRRIAYDYGVIRLAV